MTNLTPAVTSTERAHRPGNGMRALVAIGAGVLAVALTIALAAFLPRSMFLFAYVAVIVSAWYGGSWPGLATGVICVMGLNYYLIPPLGGFVPEDPRDLVPLAAFIGVSWLVGTTSESLQRARDAAWRAAAELELANQQLQEQALEVELANAQLQEQATEMEMAHEELQATAEELEERTQAAELAGREAQEARARAEEANHAKSMFLATMSHELRTPLNAIGGYVQLMEMEIRGPVTPEQREDLGRIDRSQRHLLGLINDVLDFATNEAGTASYAREPVMLDAVMGGVEGLVLPQMAEKQLAYDDSRARCGTVLLADRSRVEQVLLNLLSNAIKFTPAGGRIEVSCQPAADTVAIRVRDTGIGIPGDKLEFIFHPFAQVSAGFTRTAGGTGLGLAISRDLARGMGGDLVAESTLGEGSTFTLTLPAA
ncbi:ATP-binding protein [Longimicrobium sp.]|uniref:ATP-binding protein n=1 Tax=Longimicrobium sp. TaxID=2029185 RepID=UPI002ED952FD